jgi:hypothetical protein
VATRDLSEFHVGNPQGMVFAPSGDQTDDPTQVSLYLADSGLVTGQILELSLTQPAAVAASSFTSSLVKTTDLSKISPPSPDPDGLVYLPLSNHLFMSDSEVEETVSGITHFAGANLWEMTLAGSVTRTANISSVAPTVVPMTNEPTGVTWDSDNGHFFFSDDNACKIYNLNPGEDGLVGTAGDSWTSFSTTVGGICDSEDVTYGGNNQLFVMDGTNREVYQYTTAGSLVSHFDVAAFGVVDPEGIAFNSDSGTLFILSNSSNRIIVETAITGELLQTINVSANYAPAPAGLAYAPASDGSGVKHFYIVDRGVDNNNDPNIVDGKMFEMSAPVRTLTTTTITPDTTNPSVTGQSITFHYNVTAIPPGSGTPGGSVIVSDGAQSCTGSVADGSCSIAFATLGTKTLKATYAGDASYNSSTSTTAVTHTVNPANTTTAISSSPPDPSVIGQAVTINYSVSVTDPGSGTPTGSVTVSDGTQSCFGSVADASCSIAFATPGSKALTATYTGDGNFNGSTSTTAAVHTVNPANTTTSITSSLPDPSVIGQSVTINYSVSVPDPGSGTPTGSVTISDGTLSCSGSVADGSCSITFATSGEKALNATYAGDGNFNGSASSPAAAHTVNPANTTTAISSSLPDPSMVGKPVTISYSVAAVTPGNGTPTGSVTVSDGTQSCNGSVADGSCSITFATSGEKALTATYDGDANFNGSTSSPATAHTVNKADTTTTITSDEPDPSVVGEAVTISYSVAVLAPGSGTPTGTVTVSDGTQSCYGSVADGGCSIAFSTSGEKALTATYAGDVNFSGSISSAIPHTVNAAGTTLFITSDLPDPSLVGQPVPINYSIAVAAPGGGTPTGNVTVSDGTQSCTGTIAAGTCSITLATIGAKTLTATYVGDGNFNGSISAIESHAVRAATTTVITSDLPDPSVVGQSVPINYGVVVTAPGSGTPTGNVTVSDGTQSCTGSVAAGTCSITFTTSGAKTLTATYVGDGNFNASTSTIESHTVHAAGTTTVISSDLPDPSMFGQSVTIFYSVAVNAPGSGTPTGNVTVSDGIETCVATVASGKCTLTPTTPGAKSLTATYAGDGNYSESTSIAVPHMVIYRIYLPLVVR